MQRHINTNLSRTIIVILLALAFPKMSISAQGPTVTIDRIEGSRGTITIYYTTTSPLGPLQVVDPHYKVGSHASWKPIYTSFGVHPPGKSKISWNTTRWLDNKYYPSVWFSMMVTLPYVPNDFDLPVISKVAVSPPFAIDNTTPTIEVIASRSSILIDGSTGTAKITVTIIGGNRGLVIYDPGEVTLSTTLGKITSPATYVKNGVYSGTFTAGMKSGTAVITANISRGDLGLSYWWNRDGTTTIELIPVAKTVTVSANPTSILADGKQTSEIHITVRSFGDELITDETVSLNVNKGKISRTARHKGNGVYTATYTAPSLSKDADVTITATTSNGKISKTKIHLQVARTVTVTANNKSLIADGKQTAQVSITVRSSNNEPITRETVSLNADKGTIAPTAIHQGNGVYKATYTTPSLSEYSDVTITATTSNDKTGTARIHLIDPTSASRISLTTSYSQLPADGTSTAQVTIRVIDYREEPVTDETISLSVDKGAIDPIATYRDDGIYYATYTAPDNVTGRVNITATTSNSKVGAATLTLNPPIALITEPESRTALSGTIEVIGWATSPTLQNWILDAAPGENPSDSDFVSTQIQFGVEQVEYGTLAEWDTLVLPNGSATLRLRVTTSDGNRETFSIKVYIENIAVGSSVSVQSPTHPLEVLWYQNPNPVFRWNDVLEALGYYVILDQNPNTVPTIDNGDFLFRTEMDYPNTPDGVWYFHVSPDLEKGNAPVYHRQIRIDTKPPVIKSSTHPNQNLWSNQTSATLSWTIEHPESVDKYYYKLDKSPDTIPTDSDTATTKTTITFDNLPEGVNYFHIVWADWAGNVGQWAGHYRILRGGFSVSSSSHPDSGLWYQNSDAVFNWSKFPTASGYYVMLDGQPDTVPDKTNASHTPETTIRYPNTADGEWFFHIRPDLAVGEPVVEHLKIRIDTKPPSVTSSTHPNQELWSNQASAKLSWTVAHPESVGKYYYKFDPNPVTVPSDSDQATTETALTVNDLKEGVNYFHVVWEDKAGNVGEKAGHYRILRGGFSAESSSHPDASLWYQNQNPVFNWTAFPTATGYYVVLDGNPKTLPTAQNARRVTDTTASFPNTGDGEWFFHVRPDLAVGEPIVEHEQIRIDSKFTPTISSTTHQEAWLALSTVELEWAVIHPESVEKFYYKVDQNPNTTPTDTDKSTEKTALRLSNHPDGEYYFHVVAVDKAGDFGSDVVYYRFRIDTTPPLPVTVLESKSEGDNIILTWEAASDAHSGVAKYEVFRSNRPDIVGRRIAEPTSPPFIDKGLANDGNEYFYTVNPVDSAGNVQRIGNIRISTRTGPIKSEISVDKTRVDFGGVELGTSKTEKIEINNDGNGILDIISIKSSHPDFEIQRTVSSIPPSRSDQIEVAFKPSSTGTITATIVISVKAPNSPEQLIELRGFGTQAKLNVSQDAIDFGVVEVYKSKTQTVELQSVGTAALVISSIQVERTALSVQIDAPFIGKSIKSGESRNLSITFSPTSAAPISTTLTIISNDPNSPKAIPIRGTVASPIIAVPDTLDFGAVQIHTAGTKTLTIRNDGDAALHISSVTVDGDAEFQLVNFVAGDSLVVPIGSSKSLTIQLTPSAIAKFTGKLTISSNDPNAPEKVIMLTGSGKLPPRVVHEVSVISDASQVPANGVSVGTITITAKKSSGQPAVNQPVEIAVSGSRNIVEPTETVTDVNGVATVNIKSTKIESKTITATVGEELITRSGSTTVKFIDPVNALSISAEPQRIRADGKSQSKISINVAYPKENSVREPKPTLSLSPKLGSLNTITDNGDGTYAATYTAPEELNKTTSVTLTARIGDKSEQVALEIIHAEVLIQKIAPESIKISEITTLNGEIFPAIETDIELSFKHENQELNEPVKTDSQGKYQYKFTGTRAGAWKVTAKWGGDEQHQPTQSETLTFTVEKGKTQLTINAPENLFSLTAGDFVTVSGELTPSLGQVKLSVSLRNPDGEETTVPIQTDDGGKYQHQFKANFAGVWRVKVHFAGNDDYAENRSMPLDLPIGTELGRAIIVAGGPARAENNPLWNTTRLLCNRIFQILRERGYSRDMIYYLSPAPFEDVDGDGQDDLDGKSTVNELRKAITELPLEFFKKNPSAQLVIYYTGHSSVDKLQLGNNQEIATAQQINQWLDILQTQTKIRKIVVIIDGSQSGSFVEELADNDRTIITSTDSAKTVYFGTDGRVSFTRSFSQYIALGHSIAESFLLTEEGFIGKKPPFDIQPKLESDGDGVPNQERDRQIAKQLFIGSDINPGTTVPVIDKVSEPQTIEDTNSAEFWVEVRTVQGINEVWAVITPPDYKPPADGVSALPVVFLLPSTDGKRYEGSYDDFEKVGNYTITFFAEDLRDKISAPKQTTVTVKQSQAIDPNEDLLTMWVNIKTALLPLYPNPSNPETWIPFDLAVSADVEISIYDISGKLIRRLSLGHRKAGSYHPRARAAYWDGLDDKGERVASGIYFIQMKAGTFAQTRRLVILK